LKQKNPTQQTKNKETKPNKTNNSRTAVARSSRMLTAPVQLPASSHVGVGKGTKGESNMAVEADLSRVDAKFVGQKE